MKHLPARTCGYSGWTCIGIQTKPIYNNLAEKDCITSEHSFYKLPQKFLSVVPVVDFIDLGGYKDKFQLCTTSYQPFQQGGLFDAFSVLSDRIIDFWCYAGDPVQRPGILLPSPQLTPFQPVSAIAAPTAATNININKIQQAINNIRIGVKSGCDTGFQIIKQKRTGANEFQCYLNDGKVYVTYPGGSKEVDVKGGWIVGAKHQTTIHIIIQQDPTKEEPTFKGDWKWNLSEKQVGQWMSKTATWVIQLATIKIQSAVIDITQPLCSPIQLDASWVRPGKDKQSYVWTWVAQKDQPAWLPVKDCG